MRLSSSRNGCDMHFQCVHKPSVLPTVWWLLYSMIHDWSRNPSFWAFQSHVEERERGSRELRNTEEESWYTTNWCRFDEVVCLSLALKLCGNKVFLCFLTFCFVSKKKYIVQNTLRYFHYDLTPTKIEGVWVGGGGTNERRRHRFLHQQKQ